ncbi:hypothetical protein E2320_003548 [Naja naja]|nr:hypothetical protein E2320_003548 [Naja naja]
MVSHIFYNFYEMNFKENPCIRPYDLPKWMWIGIFAVDNNDGENFLQKKQLLLSQNGNCSLFIERLSQIIHIENFPELYQRICSITMNWINSNTNAFLAYGASYLHSQLQGISFNNSTGEKVFLNEKGGTTGTFYITNLITFPNRSFQRVKWYQPEDFTIGGMTSHFSYHLYEIKFSEKPSKKPYEIPAMEDKTSAQ